MTKKPLLFIFCFCLLGPTTNIAFANLTNGSVTLNCQGKVKLCSDCPEQNFQFISFQSASVLNGTVQNEKHSFQFNGFLGKYGEFQRLRVTEKHIIYKNSKYLISVPYVKQEDGFFAQQAPEKNVQLAPNEKPKFDWVKLCE